MPLSFTIYGNLASKSNSRKLVTFHGTSRLIKSDRALDFEQAAHLQVPAAIRLNIEDPLVMTLHVYYDSRRPDLDPSLLMDILQERKDRRTGLVIPGVYKNDRQIVEQHLFKHLDKEKPRVEVLLELAS